MPWIPLELQLSDHSIFMCTLNPVISSQLELDLSTIIIMCRIPMILDTFKSELKPSFTADIAKGFLLHADKNGELFCEEKLHNGNEDREHICGESWHVDSLNPHIINKFSVAIRELCLFCVGPEHQPSKIYEPLTGNTSSITMLASFSTPILA